MQPCTDNNERDWVGWNPQCKKLSWIYPAKNVNKVAIFGYDRLGGCRFILPREAGQGWVALAVVGWCDQATLSAGHDGQNSLNIFVDIGNNLFQRGFWRFVTNFSFLQSSRKVFLIIYHTILELRKTLFWGLHRTTITIWKRYQRLRET